MGNRLGLPGILLCVAVVGLAGAHHAGAAAGPAPAVEVGPAADAPFLDESGQVGLFFDPWSSRLAPAQGARLDHLALILRDEPDSRLAILVPQTGDRYVRRFIAARLAVLEGELGKRGISAGKLSGGAGTPENALLLRVVRPPPLRTALEILPAGKEAAALPPPDAEGGKGAAAPEPDHGAKAAPLPLLPSGQASGTAAAKTVPDPERQPAPEPEEEVWIASAGRSLHDVLKTWGDHAGWTVVWQSDREYPIEASASFPGDFTKAASQLLEGFADVAPAPLASFYKGNRVLVIRSGEGR